MSEFDEETIKDRRAVEEVLGYSVDSEPWPAAAFPLGTRVRVIKDTTWDGPWAKEFNGVIDNTVPPAPIKHELAIPGEFEYFVAFDEPQMDCDGEGPYRKAAVWGRYLIRI